MPVLVERFVCPYEQLTHMAAEIYGVQALLEVIELLGQGTENRAEKLLNDILPSDLHEKEAK